MAYRAGATEAEKEIERVKMKHRAYLKAQGRGGYVDAADMQARIRELHDVHHISFQRIADRTGVDLSNIRSHYYGQAITRPGQMEKLTRCFWSTNHAVMTTKFGPADVCWIIPATGTMRRLKALVAAGYPQSWLAERTGRAHARLNFTLVHEPKEVSNRFATEVEQLYRKQAGVDPVDAGISSRSSVYCRNVARRRGWPPDWVWDQDTIDDPDAEPEWTGSCGSDEGYRIHLRETLFNSNPMPLCRRCRAAVESRPPVREFRFDNERLAHLMKIREVGSSELGRVVGINYDSILRWRDAVYSPSSLTHIYDMASFFGVESEELVTFSDDEDYDNEEFVPISGVFSPHTLAAVMDIKGIGQREAADISNISQTTIANWVHGRRRPESMDRLKPLAQHLGIKPEDFYT